VSPGLADRRANQLGELEPIIGEHRVDLIADGGHQVPWDLSGGHFVGFCIQLSLGKPTGAVNRDKQAELAFFRADLCDIEMEVADRIRLKLLLARLLAGHIR
jgi:hypothetical protein